MLNPIKLISLLPSWVAPVAALAAIVAAGLGGYLAGRSDGRQLERSASLEATVKAQVENVQKAAEQLTRDQANAAQHAEATAKLTSAVADLLSRPPSVVTRYKEVPTHGAASVRCPAGVSADFVRDWNAAAGAADPPS